MKRNSMIFENDVELSEQLRSGNSKAYDQLMNTYYGPLCAYAYSLTGNQDNAKDIVQNVFVEIWLRRKNIKPELSIKNYLYKSVYNGFLMHYRKNKPVTFLEKKYIEAIDLAVENEHRNFDELVTLVYMEIDKLPKKCKKIFILSKKEGLTNIEISEYLNISLKTVEGHITRAFKILENKLGAKMRTILFIIFDMEKRIIS